MQDEGYTVDTVPETSAELMDIVTSHMTNDRSMLTDELLASAEGRLSSADYKAYFETLPADTQKSMIESWGAAPGDVFVYDDEVIIPGFSNGNLWITVQPPRGFWGECICYLPRSLFATTASVLGLLPLGTNRL